MYIEQDSHERLSAATEPNVEPGHPVRSSIDVDKLGSDLAPRLANAFVAIVFCALCLVSFISVLAAGYGTFQVLCGLAYLLAMLGLQLGYFSRARTRFSPAFCYPALVLQAALVYLPMLQFGSTWIGLPGLLGGSVLLALRPAASVPLFGLILGSMGWLGAIDGRGLISIVHLLVSAVITGLVVFGLTRLSRLVYELHSARDKLANLAVSEERLRFARDVHDLLGMSLSAITLKTELTNKLITDSPGKAKEELVEILGISRKALSDARSVASAYRELSLEEECRSARSVLLAAEVSVHIDQDDSRYSSRVGTVLATVLREGVTNVLRHSKAERCEITVRSDQDTARMDVVNDGLPSEAPVRSCTATSSGNGIHNLSHRVSALGGELSAEAEPDGRYRLRAVIPLERDEQAQLRASRPPWRS